MNWLLIFIPIAVVLEHFRPEAYTWILVIPQIESEAKRRWYLESSFDGAMLERFNTLQDTDEPSESRES